MALRHIVLLLLIAGLLVAGKQLRREGAENGKSSGGAGSNGNGKPADAAVGIQKGDGVYYINSPEFTGGLGKREVMRFMEILKSLRMHLCSERDVSCSC